MPLSSIPARGLNLQIWQDPSCEEPLRLHLSLDLYSSLGKLVLRYRLVVVAWPVAIALLVLRRQLQVYHSGGTW